MEEGEALWTADEKDLMALARQRMREDRVWSLDNMAAHMGPGEACRKVRTIGAIETGTGSVFVIHVDTAGEFWYSNSRGYRPPKTYRR